MDPNGTGGVEPDAFMPLFFWLGLTRRRSAGLALLELSFGPGPVRTDVLALLGQYSEVQLRLVEGLRKLARKESLEQLCEFLTESDRLRLRTWFYSMRRDPAGNADIVEVQNLFARLEVTPDRQAMFRFLTFVKTHTFFGSSEQAQKSGLAERGKRSFGVDAFASLCSRCTVAWCLHRTIGLINASAAPGPTLKSPGRSEGSPGTPGAIDATPAAAAAVPKTTADWKSHERDFALRWTQLQRKIMVSLLINHRFWGRESRMVLTCLDSPAARAIWDALTPEQWLSLFQRVRAQGMAAVLPEAEEVSDPDFLRKKVSLQDVWESLSPSAAGPGRLGSSLPVPASARF
jgi:hypothetical protein